MFDHISMKNLNTSFKVVILQGLHNHLFAEVISIQPECLQLSYRRKERIRLSTKIFLGKKYIVKEQLSYQLILNVHP